MTTTDTSTPAAPALDDVLPLTGLQEAIVYHSTRPRPAGTPDPYLILADVDLALHVPVDTDLTTRVTAALGTVMARHATLRTSYTRRRTGAPVARVHADVEVPLETCDLGTAEDLDSLRRRERIRGIALTSPPPFRAVLAADDTDAQPRRHLLVVAHHIALDGWSIHRLFDEVVRLLRGETLPAPAPVSEFLRWREGRPDDLGIWREVLSGLDSPTLVARSRRADTSGGRVISHRLGADESERLREWARAHGASLNTVIQVAWALVLADLTDTDDVVFGAVVSGRDPSVDRVDEMVGMLINTIPVRIVLDPRESLPALVSRVQREQLSLIGHHQTPLGDIQSALGMGELFDTVVVFESFPRGPVRPHIEDENSYAATILVEDDPQIRILLERPQATTADGVAERACAELLPQLVRTLTALPERPDATAATLPRSDAPPLGAAALDAVPTLPFEPVAEQIARATDADPDRAAVIVGEHTLRYADLDALTGRIADGLRTRGIGPESVVAVHQHRGAALVASILAVLRVGATYLPIDPGYPSARITFMLDDSRPDLVLDDATAELLSAAPDVADRPADRGPDGPVASSGTHPDSSAYLVYTSGSTGTPKAVLGTAGALANRVAWAAANWDGRVVLAKSSVAFIDGTTELLGALAAGATVVLADDAVTRDALALAELADAHEVDQITAVPPLAQAVAEAAPGYAPRRWIVSGEPLVPATREILTASGAEVVNSYGSSEVAGDVTMGTTVDGPVTVGLPVAGTTVVVLDRLLRPVPTGVAGEIYVGGPQLARGYRGRPEWTAARFVADPAGAGRRLYRTGDRGEIDVAGRIILHGRADSQVKIRGVRVELGEIEAALAAVDGVRDAAVRAVTDASGSTRVDAYVSGRADLAAPEVTAALADSLPAAMVPATVTVLAALPLTPGGKVDRRALPEPARASAAPSRGPATDAERAVVDAARAVLGRDAGPEDDFFDLGGHSLSATRMLTRLRVATGRRLTIADVFDHPVLADLAGLLSPADPDTAGPGGTSPGIAAATPARPVAGERPDPLPLSPAQRRLLFQSGVDDSAYTVAFTVRLDARPGSAIDVDALAASLTGIVARHEVLRTRIVDGVPVIDEASGITVALPEHRPAATDVDDLITELGARPYDLATDHVLRADLVRVDTTGPDGGTGADSAILLITVHHIAADEWSAGRLFDELAAGYHGTPVAAPAVQFTDHTVWQLDQLGVASDPNSLAAQQIQFWTGQLAGIADEVGPPVDRPRPAEPSHRGDQIDRDLPAELVTALDRQAAATGTTRFMLVHAAVAVALSASGAGDDIVVGTPFAGRTTAAAEELIGMFVNTLALRTDLAGDPTLDEVIGRIRRTDVDAYAHADLPFDEVVGALAPERSLSRHPVFQTMVQYRDPIVAPDFAGLDATPLFPPTRTSKFDLTFEFVGLTPGLRLRLEYATDLFDHATAQRLAERTLYVLRALVEHPERHLAALRMPDAADTVPALPAVSDEPARAGGATTLWEVFARAADEHATRTAVTDTAGSLTYAELGSRSERLAAQLIADGVRPGDLVALLLPRGADQVIALLAVLRAGGAYVPIDPDYPDERITATLADARPTVTVDADYCARVAPTGTPVPPVAVSPGHPAYVIYTSGSTGRPKGVTISHANVLALLSATRDLVRTDADDVWTLFHSYAFDFSVWEIWGALSTGARLVVPDRATTRSPADFAALLDAEGVTVLNQTPSAFYALDATLADTTADLASVRHLVFGGEALDAQRLTGFLRQRPLVQAVNMYGITEITVHATYLPIDARSSETSTGSDVGALLPGFTGRLLDTLMRPVPVGVVGELYLSGPQVARAYLGRPELSAVRFVADPGGHGTVSYRTGDLFRLTEDGGFHYVGRADTQVKIRGFRIELGEVRSAIAAVDGVRDAAVITRPGPGDTHRLLAYVVTDGVTPDDVHAALQQSLPEHMVPSAVVGIDRIPLTTNGKTDAAALPEPRSGTAAADRRRPADAVEAALLEIFAETLRLEPDEIALDDDFFALGGDSIVSTTLVNRARRHGLRLRTRDVFTQRTIEGLAGVAEPIDEGDARSEGTDRATGAAASGVIALLPIMHRLRELGGTIDRHNQSLVVDVPADATPQSVTTALQVVLDRHPALRTTLDVVAGGVWTLTAGEPGSVRATDVLEVVAADAHGSVADTVAAVSDAAAGRLSPTTGRMVAAVHLTPVTAGAAGRLVLVIHHLAIDGVSRRILIDDLAAAHETGRTTDAADGVPFAQVAADIATRAVAPELLGEVAHWAQVLAPGGDLVPGRPAIRGTVGAQQRYQVSLPVALSQAILTEVPARLDVGITSVFLGALRVAASAVTATGDLVVDTERHGRDTEAAGLGELDLSRTVGWFTTMAPLRLPALADGDVTAAIATAEQQWREMPSAGAGFGMLRYLNPQTAMAMATMPGAGVLLNYLGRFTVGTGGAWQPSAESTALRTAADPDLGVAHPLEIEIVCRDESAGPVITATFIHLPDQLDADLVAALAAGWCAALAELVPGGDAAHGSSPGESNPAV
ncbi:amino acid adenylation domain-containing protein [Gordonia desulfuricans]|uniref:Amino acid adenylation domain-containing protein n=3 Tax=Gordonia desulfuricans TaxID=89051 RepID=A0A7K3LMH9_9ACTN|nr:amino acid adenylation domain-containing protein [Gordonia desulfuricans]